MQNSVSYLKFLIISEFVAALYTTVNKSKRKLTYFKIFSLSYRNLKIVSDLVTNKNSKLNTLLARIGEKVR